MKIAYLVITHTDPEFTHRLAGKLTRGTDNHVFVHVDAKVPLHDFETLRTLNGTHLLDDRIAVHWAGYASIEATILLLEAAIRTDSFDRYVLLQGLDYPIKSNEDINTFFEAHANTEFIRAASETHARSNRDRHKYVLKYDMDSGSTWARLRTKINMAVLRYWPLTFPRPYVRIDGVKCEIYRGWAQFALTDAAVRYILDFHRDHPEYNSFFRHVYAADESYFHTIIYNSRFASHTVDGHPLRQEDRSIQALLNLTYFEYPDVVRVFQKKEDYNSLNKSGFLYFRKASSKSKELLEHIDECHSQLS